MTTVAEVLRKHGLAGSEDAVATRLDALLSSATSDLVGMSAADIDYLSAYGGVTPATEDELIGLAARSAARVAADAAQTLNRNEVAELLRVTPSRVSHQVADGKLYTFVGSGSRPMFPDWQFVTHPDTAGAKGSALLQLPAILAALPVGTHPSAVRSFMTTPIQDLPAGGPISPREWLRQGGSADIVVALAATVGEQV